MAYSTDISNLSPDHHWKFDGDYLDAIGSADGATTTFVSTGNPIAEDATNSVYSNATADILSLPDTTNINGVQTRHAIAGWFMTNSIQLPPTRIYGEGNNVQSFQIVMGHGNNIIFEADDPNFNLQIYSDVALEVNRAYHFCIIFEGNAYNNEFRAYLDGIKQTNANPVNRQPNQTSLTARSIGVWGKSTSTVAIGGVSIILVAPVNGYYQHWASWSDANAILTDTEVREELFEKGALPDVTISSGTESAMQTSLDIYANSVRGNAPLCIRIPDKTSGGNFKLELDNITFDPLASIHIQYTGTYTLNLINKNGSNCSIVSTTNSGTIIIKERTTITINVKDITNNSNIQNARVYIEADSGGALTVGTEIMNTITDASGNAILNFDYTVDQPIIGKVGKSSTSTYYKPGLIGGTITVNGYSQTVFLIRDE